MMKKTTLYLFMMVALIACGGDDDADNNKKPDYIVANEVMYLSDTKENILSIKANCKWVLVTDADWLTLEPASGENDGKITVTASENRTGADRSATIYMRNEANTLENTVTVNQQKAADNSFVPLQGENPLPN